jgi:hypothetical protein
MYGKVWTEAVLPRRMIADRFFLSRIYGRSLLIKKGIYKTLILANFVTSSSAMLSNGQITACPAFTISIPISTPCSLSLMY